MMKRFSKPWKVLLLAVPMLACSLTGQAYGIEFAPLYATSPTEGQIINAKDVVLWTYAINGTVNDLKYMEGDGTLSFSIPVGGVAENSLTFTSSHRFSGKLSSISVKCPEISGLVIQAYVGQTSVGVLTYNGNSGYSYDNIINNNNNNQLPRGLLYERISLKFKVASGAVTGASVSGLSKVDITIQDQIRPQYIDATPVTFGSLYEQDLSNRTDNGILFTLDSSNGDGCDEDEVGNYVLYTGSTLTDEAVVNLNDKVNNRVANYWPGDDGYVEAFKGGITAMVARGKGTFQLEAKTESNYAYHVKIGDAAPVEVASTTRQWLEVPYNVNRDTYIYIYLVDKSAAARANNDSGRSGTRIGKRETAHGIVFSLRCASAPVEVSDISVYVDYIMGRDTFIFHNADVNNDYRINVADIVKILKSK